MNNEKVDNELSLSLSIPTNEREKSANLNVGYDDATRKWELIILYEGDSDNLTALLSKYNGVEIRFLLNQFAILITPQMNIDAISREPSILYIEKPKSLFFQLQSAKSVSCITRINTSPTSPLRGSGVIVGIIDTGLDYTLNAFRNADGSSRILFAWDQTATFTGVGAIPKYDFGVEYNRELLDKALSDNAASPSIQITDITGHGTAVTRIAAGNDGVAPDSIIIFVKLGLPSERGFPRTTQLMCGIDYIMTKAMELSLPVSINISFGNNYGDHMGRSLLERYIDSVCLIWKNNICIGTGNEAIAGTHFSSFTSTEPINIRFSISPYERNLNMQIWKYHWDDFDITITFPDGTKSPINKAGGSTQEINYRGTTLLIYVGTATPFSVMQEIYFEFLAQNEYIEYGIWEVRLVPIKILYGRVDAWLPDVSTLNPSTGFLNPDPENTFTIPSTSSLCISVGAYDSSRNSYADFSGRGFTLRNSGYGISKPELCAPGVDITVGTQSVTGTSFATPFVTGACALLMEWGITKGNDPFMYGEKIKSILISNVKKLPDNRQLPNSKVGYGALCVPDPESITF